MVRLTRERSELLSREAAALGRDPGTIGRIFLAGFSPGAAAPWASVGAFEELVGRYRELGFDEFVVPEPTAGEWSTFERAIGEVIPRLRAR